LGDYNANKRRFRQVIGISAIK